MKTSKMAKYKQINLIAIVKILNICFINKYTIINSGMGEDYSVLVNYQSNLVK